MSALTLKPDLYADVRGYLMYEGHDLSLAAMDTIWSVGKTPEAAIRAFCKARLGTNRVKNIEDMPGGDTRYEWGRRFTCQGTGFKAAGILIPGGVLLTWWK